jgi:hypothetical protein
MAGEKVSARARQARLAAELRSNLGKRKQQARARAQRETAATAGLPEADRSDVSRAPEGHPGALGEPEGRSA